MFGVETKIVKKRIKHVSAQDGYDHWSDTYDETPNPVVHMDERHTPRLLALQPGERILDAGCGTGRHFYTMLNAGSSIVGTDFAAGMLRLAAEKYPEVWLVRADLQRPLPFLSGSFDVVLCSLVGEHLAQLAPFFREMHRLLRAGGRLLFSVYHPAMAAAGIEANFEKADVEFRLGKYDHTVQDYCDALEATGFGQIQKHEHEGDEQMVAAVPEAKKYLGFPLLLIILAEKIFE